MSTQKERGMMITWQILSRKALDQPYTVIPFTLDEVVSNFRGFVHKATSLLNFGLVLHWTCFLVCLIQRVIQCNLITFSIPLSYCLRNDTGQDFARVLQFSSVNIIIKMLPTHKWPNTDASSAPVNKIFLSPLQELKILCDSTSRSLFLHLPS
jgi:hypothetical protein